MGRRKKRRVVQDMPEAVFFKPQGIPMRELERLAISVEEFEALRLVDNEGLMQQEAADRMGVSRPTLSRILGAARKGVATALSNGWAIEIEGGSYHLACSEEDREQCTQYQEGETMPGMNRGRGQGMGQGRGQGGGNGRGQGRGQGMGNGQCARQRQQTPTSTAKPATGATMSQVNTIAITSDGPTLDHKVDPRFGRAGGFVIVDLKSMNTKYVDNGASQVMNQGAGIQAAENVANAGADAVLTGYVGPKAFAALSAAKILVGQDVDGLTVKEAVERFKAGDITVAAEANAKQGSNK